MNTPKIYVREADVSNIGMELIRIVEASVREHHTNPTKSTPASYQELLNKLICHALACYFGTAEKLFCENFINYYEFEETVAPEQNIRSLLGSNSMGGMGDRNLNLTSFEPTQEYEAKCKRDSQVLKLR
jgi:hypothetical protein